MHIIALNTVTGLLQDDILPVEMLDPSFWSDATHNDHMCNTPAEPRDCGKRLVTPHFELSQMTDALFRGLDLVLEHHGCPAEIRQDLDAQLHSYADTAPNETVWLKRMKYVLTYPQARYLHCEVPSLPDVVFKPAGRLRRWMKNRLISFNRKNTHLWYSWLQAKRAALPLSEEMIEKTYDEHFQTLSGDDPGYDKTIDEIFSDPTFQSVLGRVRKGMMDRLARRDVRDETPSTSACFEAGRKWGGSASRLRSLVDMDYDTFTTPELYSMGPRSESRGEYISHSITEDKHRDVSNWCKNLERSLCTCIQKAKSERSPLSCVIQAVLEPFKVRVISKGEALEYHSQRPLQKALHSAMRGMDCFRLIGRPFSPTDVIGLRRDPSHLWFSVDYSAATDGLSFKYSSRIFRFLVGNLHEDDYHLAMRVLGMHELFYPEGPHTRYRGLQKNGQLMGSILSFPVLCLANLGVYLRVTRKLQKNWTNRDRLSAVLVNGDDMVYAAPRKLWKKHVKVAARVGLKMSVGKAYLHDTYLNVNSTSVHCPPHFREDVGFSTPWQIPFLNSGMFFGQKKVLSDEEEMEGDVFKMDGTMLKPTTSYVSNLEHLLEGSLPGKQKDLLQRYLKRNGDKINSECMAYIVPYKSKGHAGKKPFARNLFIPTFLGGMGITPPPEWKYTTNSFQKHLAQSLARERRLDTPLVFGPVPHPLMKLESNKVHPSLVRAMCPDEELDIYHVKYEFESAAKIERRCGYKPYKLCPKVPYAPESTGITSRALFGPMKNLFDEQTSPLFQGGEFTDLLPTESTKRISSKPSLFHYFASVIKEGLDSIFPVDSLGK